MTTIKTEQIRQLNDILRKQMAGGKFMLTRAVVHELSDDDRTEVIGKVRQFDAFTEDNDPHGEHDFGAFDHNGQKFFWKIDYYGPDMMHHSEDAADPEKTVRVLTVMRSDEY